jgi:predicted nucleic acid-binding protein
VIYLIDTSALHRFEREPDLKHEWNIDIDEGDIASCYPQRAEYLYSATSSKDYLARADMITRQYRDAPVPKRAPQWVDAVQTRMASHGQHRSAGAIDLIIAATAAHHGLIVIHCDNDFHTIAKHAGDLREININTMKGTSNHAH